MHEQVDPSSVCPLIIVLSRADLWVDGQRVYLLIHFANRPIVRLPIMQKARQQVGGKNELKL